MSKSVSLRASKGLARISALLSEDPRGNAVHRHEETHVHDLSVEPRGRPGKKLDGQKFTPERLWCVRRDRPRVFSHVLRRVGESGAVLRGRVLRAVRGNVTQNHHDGTVGIHPLGQSEVVDAVVGDDIRQVILWRKHTTVFAKPLTWSSKISCCACTT